VVFTSPSTQQSTHLLQSSTSPAFVSSAHPTISADSQTLIFGYPFHFYTQTSFFTLNTFKMPAVTETRTGSKYDAIPGPLGLASASLEGKVALVTGAGKFLPFPVSSESSSRSQNFLRPAVGGGAEHGHPHRYSGSLLHRPTPTTLYTISSSGL
jgi:hypothetical protein